MLVVGLIVVACLAVAYAPMPWLVRDATRLGLPRATAMVALSVALPIVGLAAYLVYRDRARFRALTQKVQGAAGACRWRINRPLLGLLFAVEVLALAWVLSALRAMEWSQALGDLSDAGIPAVAEVVELRMDGAGSDTRHVLQYRFRESVASPDRSHTDSLGRGQRLVEVPAADWNRAREQRSIDVRYLQRDPNVNAPASGDWSRVGRSEGLLAFLFLLPQLLMLPVLVGVAALVVRAARAAARGEALHVGIATSEPRDPNPRG